MFELFDPHLLVLTLACGVVTLINRLAGHYILTLFEPIPYRVEAALEAVPMAVMVTLVVPAALNGGWIEWTSLAVAAFLCTRVQFVFAVAGGWGLLMVLRLVTGG